MKSLMTAAIAGMPMPAWASFHAGEAALMGQARVFDPYKHYPSETGINDPTSGCRFFFHHHRPDEFGHFHTFGRDEFGAPIHIVMITIDKAGKATRLTTTNQWVTGTRYIDAEGMKAFINGFRMRVNDHPQRELMQFIEGIVQQHRDAIHRLYIDHDRWLATQRSAQNPDPFKDKAHEEISSVSLVKS